MPSSKDPVINRQKANEYRLAHPEWHRDRNREWSRKKRAENPEWARGEGRKHRERQTPERRAERAEYQKQWFSEHPTYSRDKQAEEYKRRPVRQMVARARVRARHLGVPFDLDWRTLVVPEVCPVLGVPLSVGNGVIQGSSPSLDRVIPALGYVAANVRVISQAANSIKRDKTIDELRLYAETLRVRLEAARLVVVYLERELG